MPKTHLNYRIEDLKMFIIGTLTFIVIAGALLISCIRIVPEKSEYIVERLGAYQATWQPGLHFLIPVIDRIACKVNLKENVLDFEPQSVITKDNVTMKIDTVVYARVFDSKMYAYGVTNPISALGNLTATTLRNIIGDLELDETLTSRDTINAQMQSTIDEATDCWGLRVSRVELKSIIPPQDIQESMEKQMRAEREKRARILEAEGIKQSEILTAQGEKESTILRAEAKRDAMIAEAEGKARAIEVINKAKPTSEYIRLESLATMAKVANGQSTKLIIPSDLQNIVTNSAAFKEVALTNE